MPAKFKGSREELDVILERSGYSGSWTTIQHGQQFRGRGNEILNWFTTGTLQFQGPSEPRRPFEARVTAELTRATTPPSVPAGAITDVTIYSDGGCSPNPGSGGYGAVLRDRQGRREYSGGYRLTTNNRMELLGAIRALEALKEPCAVTLHSDSQYVVRAMNKGWAERWRSNGWQLTNRKKAANPDLWDQMLTLCEKHEVTFEWVRGHSGDPENERCDWLATEARRAPDLPIDAGYRPMDHESS